MRTANFRDDVLWAVAYQLGDDPDPNRGRELDVAEAAALTSFINAWVRRLYDATDFPEWTATVAAQPDANHIVPYDIPGPPIIELGRILKVHLVDPTTTPGPFDAPFRLDARGIRVIGDHGTNVWVKYLPRAPQFTAEKWDGNRNYGKAEITYSPRSGNCYKSKAANNRGHDPADETVENLGMELIQERTPDNPGLAGRPEIMVIDFSTAVPPPAPPSVPANGDSFRIIIRDQDENILADVQHTADGVETLSAIITLMATALDAALPGSFVVTPNTTLKTITLQDNSYFRSSQATWYPVVSIVHNLKVVVTQTYIAPMSGTPGAPQLTKITMPTGTSVVTGTIYGLIFTGGDGIAHTIQYTTVAGDAAPQVLMGLINAKEASTDDFIKAVQVSGFDPAALTLTLASDKAILDRFIEPPPDPAPPPPSSLYWQVIPFPMALVDSVVRGVYADALKEGGQTDKAAGEEQLVPAEVAAQTSTFKAPQYDELTDQAGAKSRYAVR